MDSAIKICLLSRSSNALRVNTGHKPIYEEYLELRVWIYEWVRRITFYSCPLRGADDENKQRGVIHINFGPLGPLKFSTKFNNTVFLVWMKTKVYYIRLLRWLLFGCLLFWSQMALHCLHSCLAHLTSNTTKYRYTSSNVIYNEMRWVKGRTARYLHTGIIMNRVTSLRKWCKQTFDDIAWPA